MRAVRSTDTSIELTLRQALWRRGVRYRKNYRGATGKPDLAFISLKIAVFCDSEFWHGRNWEVRKNDFKSNQSFWHQKIERNIQRDRQVTDELQSAGWLVLRFWEREITEDTEGCVRTIEQAIDARRRILRSPKANLTSR